MKALLIYNKVYEVIEINEEDSDDSDYEPSTLTKKELKTMSNIAHSVITLHLSDKVLRLVGGCTTAIELWEKLDKLYLVKSLPNQILLKEKLFSFKCSPSKTFEESLDAFIKITTDLANIGAPVDSLDQAVILLNSLPEAYNDVKSAIKYGRDTLDFETVVDALKSKDLDLRKERKGNEALFSRGREEKRSFGQNSSFGYGNSSAGNRSKARSKSKPRKETRKCHYCNKEGHLRRNCFEWKRNKGKTEAKDEKGGANVANEPPVEEFVFTTQGSEVEEALITHSRENEWIMDTGCTYHMTQNKDFIFDMQPAEGKKVYMGNNQFCNVEGIGSVRLILHNNCEGILSNVRYVPELKRNLISLGILDKSGYSYKSSNGILKILKGSLVKMRAELTKGLYVLDGHAKTAKEHALNVSGSAGNEAELWHKRLGHISENGLLELHKQGLFGKSKFCPLGTCEFCICGKAKRVQFEKGLHCTKGKLDYIHSDLWGPASTTTYGGNRYFLSIIDDFSRKVWVFPLKLKSEVFQKFKDWLILIQNQTDRKVKVLRTDNGLEYLNSSFERLCNEQGIRRHLTIPYTPQQNGVAERMNRTILERARCMLLASNLPKELWGEAVVTAGFLINRSPSAPLDGRTPEEVWTGLAPRLENLKVFGCAAYAHALQDKLEARAVKCVFLGYSNENKGYKLWCIEEGKEKLIVSRNVRFVETEMPYKAAKTGENSSSSSLNPTILERYEDLGENPSAGNAGSTGNSAGNGSGSCSNGSGYGGSSSGRTASGSGSSLESSSSQRVVSTASRSGSTGSRDRSFENQGIGDSRLGSGSGSPDEHGSGSGSSSGSHPQIYEDTRNQQDLRMDSDRIRRQVRPPIRYGFDEYALNVEEPLTLKAVEESKERKEWHKAIKEELESLSKNNTWVLVEKPLKQKLVGCKWIFKAKSEGKGENKIRFKARLVAKGYTQEYGVDFNEVFSPVVRHTSIRVLLSLTAKEDLELEQMDVKTAFLHGDLEEKIYMMQPPGFEKKGEEDKVCLLKKSIYGLKQSPRQWYMRFDTFIVSKGFKRSMFDSCVYIKHGKNSDSIYLLLYVDDMLIACRNLKEIEELKVLLSREFEMKDLGPSKDILGMEIRRERRNRLLFLSQENYISKLLKRFNLEDAKSVSLPLAPHFKLSSEQSPKTDFEIEEMASIPYSNAVGSLMYCMVCTRPDLAYSLSLVSRFMGNPGRSHWEAVKWVMRYLNGSRSCCLVFEGEEKHGTTGNMENKSEIVGFVDADYAADLDKRRSLTGYVFKVFGNTVSWKSTLQHVVALSTTESEYIALSEAVKEGMWLKGLVAEFCNKECSIEINCDSQSAIHLSKHQAHHERTKHIDVKLHFLRDVLGKKDFHLLKVSTQLNTADMFTKVVPKAKFDICLGMMGLGHG